MASQPNKLPWLNAYSGQSVDELLSLEGQYRIDSLICAFEQAIYQKEPGAGESNEERLILAVEALEREVNNGGYAQFFENAGEYASIIVESLRRIGCNQTAALTQLAVDTLGTSDLTANEIKAAIAREDPQRDATFNQCDKDYFSNPEPIAERLFEFIKINKANIILR